MGCTNIHVVITEQRAPAGPYHHTHPVSTAAAVGDSHWTLCNTVSRSITCTNKRSCSTSFTYMYFIIPYTQNSASNNCSIYRELLQDCEDLFGLVHHTSQRVDTAHARIEPESIPTYTGALDSMCCIVL